MIKTRSKKLVIYYLNEFEDFNFDLDNYICYVRKVDNAFSNLKGLKDLSMS